MFWFRFCPEDMGRALDPQAEGGTRLGLAATGAVGTGRAWGAGGICTRYYTPWTDCRELDYSTTNKINKPNDTFSDGAGRDWHTHKASSLKASQVTRAPNVRRWVASCGWIRRPCPPAWIFAESIVRALWTSLFAPPPAEQALACILRKQSDGMRRHVYSV